MQSGDAGNYSVVVNNSVGSVTSTLATLAVTAVAPTITTQPTNQIVNAGTTVTFSVTAAGSAPLSYHWRKNGSPIADATSASYSLANPQTVDAGTYSVVVSNGVGSVTSASASLTVNTTQPIRLAVKYWQANDYPNQYYGGEYQDVWVSEYRSVDEYDDDGNWIGSYSEWIEGWESQWVEDFAPDGIHGPRWSTTAGTFNIADTSSKFDPLRTDRGYFLTSFSPGHLVTFHVHAAAPSANCSDFEFRLFAPNGAQVAGNGFSGQFAWSFYANLFGNYRIELTFKNATATNPTTGTVRYYIPVGVATPPTIVTQPGPAYQALNAGSTAVYSVTSSGASSFQWYKEGASVLGATSATLTRSNLQSVDAGNYHVVLSNGAGATTSNGVTLVVNAVPTINTQPVSAMVTIGQSVTFTVGASGAGGLTYQWRKNGSNIVGATGASLNLSNVQASAAGSYDVVVANPTGSATSTIATLVVNSVGDDGTAQLRIHRPL